MPNGKTTFEVLESEMSPRLFRAGLAVSLFLLPSLAHAYCPEPRRYFSRSFEAQVNSYIDHLICLHNEQVTSLNQHAETINGLGTEIDTIRRNIAQVVIPAASEQLQDIAALEQENERLRRRIEELETRLDRFGQLLE